MSAPPRASLSGLCALLLASYAISSLALCAFLLALCATFSSTSSCYYAGTKEPELAKRLCVSSADGVDWLMEEFNLDPSLVTRLGGYSQPRTHRGKERFPGMTIT